jgi:ATP-binding cassette subfamily F protein 3
LASHDRDLLNRAVGSIVHLDRGKLTLYSGGYDTFEETRREKQRLDLKLQKKQEEQRRHLEAFITRFKAKASKAAQAQSRIKALARMQPIAAEVDERVVPFNLPGPEKLLASPILQLERASVGYAAGHPVLSRLDLRIDQDDRIALLGQNGNGKSTFAKLIAGRLAPLDGTMRRSPKLEVGYFAQHQLDDLAPELTPFEQITRLMPSATEAERRSRLGTWGFGAAKADTKAKNLSGGEKARLLMAMTAFHAPHILILDEPTNHLDVDSREALVHALNEYEGAVILISHDRHLIDASADRLWIVRNGTVRPYEGDMESYRAELLAERGGRTRARPADERPAEGRSSRVDQRRDAAEKRAQLAPLRKEVQTAERRMEELSTEIAHLDAALADPGLYTRDAAEAQKLVHKRGLKAKALAEAEEAWLMATEALEAAAAVS